MNVKELSQLLGLKRLTDYEEGMDKQVSGVYTCDLLSHAKAKINACDVWITVHTNLNVIAVASLTDCSCVIIPESIEVEEQSIVRAQQKGVIILSSNLSAAQLCYHIMKQIEKVLS